VRSTGGLSVTGDTEVPGAKPVPLPLIHRKSHIN
jgi:hypothetical protein